MIDMLLLLCVLHKGSQSRGSRKDPKMIYVKQFIIRKM